MLTSVHWPGLSPTGFLASPLPQHGRGRYPSWWAWRPLREQGILPFFAWFAANTAAIQVFGWLSQNYLACAKELWIRPVASFHGKYVNFDEMTIAVRLAQQPYPFITLGRWPEGT